MIYRLAFNRGISASLTTCVHFAGLSQQMGVNPCCTADVIFLICAILDGCWFFGLVKLPYAREKNQLESAWIERCVLLLPKCLL